MLRQVNVSNHRTVALRVVKTIHQVRLSYWNTLINLSTVVPHRDVVDLAPTLNQRLNLGVDLAVGHQALRLARILPLVLLQDLIDLFFEV